MLLALMDAEADRDPPSGSRCNIGPNLTCPIICSEPDNCLAFPGRCIDPCPDNRTDLLISIVLQKDRADPAVETLQIHRLMGMFEPQLSDPDVFDRSI